MPVAVAALRQAVEVVRAQIPKGELTLASVQRLLEAAETVCQNQELASPAANAAEATGTTIDQAPRGAQEMGPHRQGGRARGARRADCGRVGAIPRR